jgi:hypothetical protein
MGIVMDDIHAPTVASGPSSGAVPRDLSKLSMTDLMQEKQRLEDELKALSAVLDSVRLPGMLLSLLLTHCFLLAWRSHDLISNYV